MSFTEEAFLFSSFQEALKVWRKGSGQATFSLQIVDGKADLQLSFKLGHPCDLHFEQDVPLVQDHDQDYVGQPCRHHHRRKGPARREKDRLRAIKHQAQFQPDQDVIDKKNEAVSAELILPFDGKLLPIRDNANSVTAAAPAVTPAAACGPPPPCAPSKPGQASANFETKKKADVDQAKKKLFVALQMPNQESPTTSTGYARKEEELWSKLFT